MRGGKLATAEGVSYLEAKHLLLLHYCINIVFYLLLKAEGRPVRDHPVIARLLELRAYLEKIRPIDKKLQYQMEKLLMVAQLQVSSCLICIPNRPFPPPLACLADSAPHVPLLHPSSLVPILPQSLLSLAVAVSDGKAWGRNLGRVGCQRWPKAWQWSLEGGSVP